MPEGPREIGWWSPARRGVIPPGGVRVTRSLRRSARRFEIRVDTAFDHVIRACGDGGRPGGQWITAKVVRAYSELHRLGWAHSVEAWLPGEDEPAGGLYGVAIGGLFAGESMFHRATDASKAALLGLVEMLGPEPDRLLDVQWVTPHLATLGAVEVPRPEYLRRLHRALPLALPAAFEGHGPLG